MTRLTDLPPDFTDDDIDLFWSLVDRKTPAECWPWLGSPGRKRHHTSYGAFHRRGVSHVASRLAYRLAVGPIPHDLHILHSCDNPPCCNPAHLRAGTPKENSQDCIVRGRRRHAPRYGPLPPPDTTDDTIATIRAALNLPAESAPEK